MHTHTRTSDNFVFVPLIYQISNVNQSNCTCERERVRMRECIHCAHHDLAFNNASLIEANLYFTQLDLVCNEKNPAATHSTAVAAVVAATTAVTTTA